MIGRDKIGKLRRARTSLVISMFLFVSCLFAWIVQVWRYGTYWMILPAFGGTSLLFFIFFLKSAPLCPECKRAPWSIFSRTAICCFAEKVSLRKAVQRTLKTFAILYIVGGLIVIYIRPIYAYGMMATRFIEKKMRRPALESFEREEAALRARLAENPNDKDAHLQLGWLYYRADKLSQAAVEYNLVAKMDPEHPDPDALLLQAIILGELKQALPEEKTYERLLELQPDNTEALINLGLVYMRNKLYDRAKDKLEKAHRILQDEVRRLEKKLQRTKAGEDQPPQPPPPGLQSRKKHLGIVCYHLAVVTQLLGEKAKSGAYLNDAKRYGIKTVNFSNDVERFRR